MIAELVENVSHHIRRDYRNGEPEDALPRTGYEWRGPSGISKDQVSRERTFAMDP